MAYKKQKQYRLPGYDYAQPGEYFITICTKDRNHFLGEVQKGSLLLSDAGKIAQIHLLEISDRFDNVELDEWVIMPNHVHMILIIVDDRRNMTVAARLIMFLRKRPTNPGYPTTQWNYRLTPLAK